MKLPDVVVDGAMKTMNLVHRGLLSVSGGRIGSSIGPMPVVQLHTTGRSSGRRRTVMLTAPIHGPDRYVLVASKGGDDRHPQWYLNLVADPDIELTVDGETRPMTARTATPDEKAAMWPEIVDAYRGYSGYQSRTDRDIPVVICEPRSH
ncbi:MAG: nitroreductase family deazaflavin-dependent oxidoreductase [Ilumatobacter sp.]|nr:MAG: nitroreductase family deazaflavin-dependent oxidoreductase [Ilumatobacter sp.]